tara:strand:+ start:44 stop:394 length:351 start_codon:yes stop_codon:yes gene_type:complete
MARYAHLQPNTNVVLEVIKADAKYIRRLPDANEWVEVSEKVSGLGVGSTYYADRDCFIPQPIPEHPSWVYDFEEEAYVPPVPMPLDRGGYYWDDSDVCWKADTTVGIASTSEASEL